MSILIELEHRAALGPTKAAALLGVSYTSYKDYKNGRRLLPLYIERSVQAHLALSEQNLRRLVRDTIA